MNCWITTHWPVPDENWPRHVYVKDGMKSLPQPGDTVFLYESKYAIVDGLRSKSAKRVHHNHRGPDLELPVGFGGIIGQMSVSESHRSISESDIVYEYAPDNLRVWSIIPCGRFLRSEHPVPLVELVAVLGWGVGAPATPLRLCRITEHQADAICLRMAGKTAPQHSMPRRCET